MKRRLVKQGAATMMVSLPAKWVKENKLSKGDEIDIKEEENRLILSGKGEDISKRTISYELKLLNKKDEHNYRYIRSLLGSAYRKGYDSIKLNFQDSSAIGLIQKAVDSLIGYEIMDQTENSCKIKNMISKADIDFDSSFKKIFHVIRLMQNIIIEDMVNKRFERITEMSQLKNTGWKFRDLCLRIIDTESKFRENIFAFSLIVWTVEKISSQLFSVYEYLSREKPRNISEDTLKFIKSAYNYFDIFEKAYLSEKLDSNIQLLITKEDILKQSLELLKEKSHNPVLIHFHALIVRRIYDMNSSLITLKSR